MGSSFNELMNKLEAQTSQTDHDNRRLVHSEAERLNRPRVSKDSVPRRRRAGLIPTQGLVGALFSFVTATGATVLRRRLLRRGGFIGSTLTAAFALYAFRRWRARRIQP